MRLSKRLKKALVLSFSSLYAAGAIYWMMRTFFRHAGEFGEEPHWLERLTGPIHLAAALFFLFVAGIVWGQHVGVALKLKKYRVSGWAFVALMAALGASGVAILYGSEGVIHWGEKIHPYLGLSLLPFLVLHWRRKPAGRHDRKTR